MTPICASQHLLTPSKATGGGDGGDGDSGSTSGAGGAGGAGGSVRVVLYSHLYGPYH